MLKLKSYSFNINVEVSRQSFSINVKVSKLDFENYNERYDKYSKL